MNRLLVLVLIALMLALMTAMQAFAGEVTVLAGVSKFTDHGDGVWYQSIFPYRERLTSPSLGIRYDTRTGDHGYSVGYMALGTVSSSAIAVGVDAPGDGGYDPVTKSCVNGCMPTSHWYGEGSVQGVFASLVRYHGPWAVEAGLYLYRPTWTVTVPDWRGCRDCAPMAIQTPDTFHWQVGPMLGVRYQTGNWSLNLSTWHTQTEKTDYSSLYHNQTYNLSLGYAFK